jgi:hypothetical protein
MQLKPRLGDGEWQIVLQEDEKGIFVDLCGVVFSAADTSAPRAAQIKEIMDRVLAVILTAEGL